MASFIGVYPSSLRLKIALWSMGLMRGPWAVVQVPPKACVAESEDSHQIYVIPGV